MVVPQANPAAFEAAGRVPLRPPGAFVFVFLGSFFCRSVVNITFRRSGLDPRELVCVRGTSSMGTAEVGEADAGGIG